ncbi:MAG: glycosyltransferase family A protein [Bacteroidia bacterium]
MGGITDNIVNFPLLLFLDPSQVFSVPHQLPEFTSDIEEPLTEEKFSFRIHSGMSYEACYLYAYLYGLHVAYTPALKHELHAYYQLSEGNAPSLVESYRLLFQFYPSKLMYWILFMRIASLKNFIKEFKAFKVAKKNPLPPYPNSENTTSESVSQVPHKVSVIIPTRNRSNYLLQVLQNINAQTYRLIEVLIIDQSDIFSLVDSSVYFFPLQHIKDDNRGQSSARNKGIELAKGEYLLFVDDDMLVNENWVEGHLKAFQDTDTHVSCGHYYEEETNSDAHSSGYRIASQIPGNNFMVRSDFFTFTGKFKTTYDGFPFEDNELFFRAIAANRKMILNRKAAARHLQASQGGMREYETLATFQLLTTDKKFIQLHSTYHPNVSLTLFKNEHLLFTFNRIMNLPRALHFRITLIVLNCIWYTLLILPYLISDKLKLHKT